MTETKQQVFDYLIDRTIAISLILGMPEPQTKQFKQDFTALWDNASDETPEQAECPYCHGLRLLGDSEEDEIVLQGGNLHVAMTVPVGFDNGWDEEDVSINYCPMCARKLETHHG